MTALTQVQDLMLAENRPFSANDVCSRLEKEIGKSAICKALEELTDSGVLMEKLVAKQKIYYANQDQFDKLSPTESRELDLSIMQLGNDLAELVKDNKSMEIQLKELTSGLTLGQIVEKTSVLTAEVVELRSKLAAFQGENVRPVTKEEIKAAEKNREKFVTGWRKRKRMATDMFNSILETYPKKQKEWFEEVGVETDEDKNVKVPS